MSADRYAANSPYVGPRPFEAGQPLFGRDGEVRDLRDLLIAHRIVLFYSPSGAGKTSLLQAGLGPTLAAEGFAVRPIIRVGVDPSTFVERPAIEQNRYVLSALYSLERHAADFNRMLAPATAALDLETYLDEHPPEPSAAGTAGLELLIFDQFEEILTVDPSHEELREELFEQVGDALRNRRRWALFSLREDYIAGLDPYAHLIPTEFRTRFRLDLLNKSAALEAVRKPAEAAGASFTEAAAERLVDDLCRIQVQQAGGRIVEETGQYVEPVQLQVVCLRIWRDRDPQSDMIDLDDLGDVRDLSNVDAALADYYAGRVATLASTKNTPEREIREWVERRLITAHGIRGQVLQEPERSQGLANSVIQGLEDAHLVRGDHRRGATWYELAHDRLVRPIQANNAEWFTAHLTAFQLQAELWQREGEREGLLLSGDTLSEAEQWAAEPGTVLTDVEQEFLRACQNARRRAEDEEARREAQAAIERAAQAEALLQAESRAREAAESRAAEAQARQEAEETLRHEAELRERAEAQRREVAEEQRAAARRGRRHMFAMTLLSSVVAVVAIIAFTYAWQQSDLATERYGVAIMAQATAAAAAARAADARATAVSARDQFATQNILAEQQSSIAAARELATAAASAIGVDPELSVLLALQSVATVYPAQMKLVPEAHAMLNSAVQASRIRHSYPPPEEGGARDNSVVAVSFSPDGKLLVSANSVGVISVRDVATSALVSRLRFPVGADVAVAFAPDGRTVTAVGARPTGGLELRVWDVATWQEIQPSNPEPTASRVIDFSPDGHLLVGINAAGALTIWDAATLAVVQQSQLPESILLTGATRPKSLTVTPDGSLVAIGGYDGMITIVPVGVPDGKVRTIRTYDATRPFDPTVYSVVFSPDGRTLAATSNGNSVRMWRAEDGRSLPILTGHTGRVFQVAFSRDGAQMVTASADRTARVWDSRSGAALVVLTGHSDMVKSAGFSPDGFQVATGSQDQNTRIWDARRTTLGLIFSGHQGGISSIAFSPDGQHILSGGSDKTVRVWDTGQSEPLHTLYDHRDVICCVAYGHDGQTVAAAGGTSDMTVHVWNASTGDLLARSPPFSSEVRSLAAHPSAPLLVIGLNDGTISTWDGTADGQPTQPQPIPGTSEPVTGSPVPAPTTPVPATGTPEPVPITPVGVSSLSFSRDGRQLVLGTERGQTVIVQTSSLAPIEAFRPTAQRILGVALNVKNRVASAGELGIIDLFDLSRESSLGLVPSEAGGPVRLSGHTRVVHAVTFTPDGDRLASASDDTTARVWDVASRQELLSFTQSASVRDVAFSPDGNWLATGGADRLVHLYPLDLDQLIDLARTRVTRSFTRDECQKYLHVQTCPPGLPGPAAEARP
jgi:WD40 repeat protein